MSNVFWFMFQHDDDSEWNLIKPDIFASIMDFFATGLPVIDPDIPQQVEEGELKSDLI